MPIDETRNARFLVHLCQLLLPTNYQGGDISVQSHSMQSKQRTALVTATVPMLLARD
jgi:hypothetical protein